jgi:hypothetical protein
MANESRKATRAVLELIADGVLDKDTVILACLNYMSEYDVADMAHANGFIEEPDDESEGEDETD